MTREVAMYLLNNLRSVAEGEEDEAIDMAIEALQTDEVVTIQTGQTYGKSAYIKEFAEVVRCKDCGNFDYAFNYCNFLDAGVEGDDFFCAYGERKGGENK